MIALTATYAGPGGIYNNDWMLTGPQFDYGSGTSAQTGQAYSENTPMGIEASRTRSCASLLGLALLDAGTRPIDAR